MADYEANVTADFSGYNSSVQQAIALTKEYTAAHEGIGNTITRTGAKAINQFNDSMGVTQKVMKANVAEAANYQQVLGKVSATAVAAGKSARDARQTTQQIARRITGDIGSAADVVAMVQKSGFTDPKKITSMTKAIVELGAATGESGSEIAMSLKNISQSYGKLADPQKISDLGDSLVTTTAKFGASATAAAGFAKQVAPFAQQIGMSQSSLIGFGTAFAKAGDAGTRTANVFSRMLSDVDLAVREGLPTLDVYAATIGKSVGETRKMAEENPADFIVQTLEALQAQGPEGIRTLQALGLEGVRTQRDLRQVIQTADLPQIIATAQASYGTGSTGEAAAEQLNGLNEQTMKLQESMKQLVVDTGAPMLSWLENVTSLSTKAADAMAGIAESDLFQLLAGGGGIALAGTALAMKGLSAAWTAGGIGAAIGQVNAMGQVPGQPGRVETLIGRIGANRGKLMGAGLAGMMAAPMLDQPGLGTAGMMALMAGTLIGPQTFQKTQRAFNFLTSDAAAAWKVPFTEWPGGKFDLESRVRAGAGAPDQFAFARKRAKELGLDEVTEALKSSQGVITPGSKGKQFGTALLQEIVEELLQETPDVGKIRPATRALREGAETLIEGGTQTAAMRAAAMARQAGGTAAGFGRGFATQLGAIAPAIGAIGTPALVAGGVLAAAGGGLWLNQQAQQRAEALRSPEIRGREEAYETFGKVAETFDGLIASGEGLTQTFDDLASTIAAEYGEKGAGPGGKAAEVFGTGLSAQQFAAIKAEKPSTELEFQNRRFLWQTTGSQMTSLQAISELLSVYGTKGTQESIAMITSDLKAMGKTQEEVDKAVEAYTDVTSKGPMGALKHALEDFKRNRGGGPWEADTFADVIKAVFADTKEMGKEGQAQMLGEFLAEHATGLSQAQLDGLITQMNTIFGFEGSAALPNLKSTMPTPTIAPGTGTGYVPTLAPPVEIDTAAIAAENKKLINEWRTTQYGREIGGLEMLLSGTGLMKAGGPLGQAMAAEARRASEIETETQASIEGKVSPVADQQAAAVIKGLSEATKAYGEGSPGENMRQAITVADQIVKATGSIDAALQQVHEFQQEPVSTATAQVLQGIEDQLTHYRGIEFQGMTEYEAATALRRQGEQKLASVGAKPVAEQTAEEKAQVAEGIQEVQQGREDQMNFMRKYLSAYRDFQKQLEYANKDYQRTVRYANEDFAKQQEYAQADYHRQVQYAQDDHNTQMLYMEQDYQKTLARAERDYDKQRLRMMEQFEKQVARRAEDAAKAMYDPFQRIAVEQTWSAEGLLSNLTEQLEMFQEQAANLDKLRGMGVNQSVIDALGLNDPNKAQQLERMLGDLQQIPNAGEVIGQLNANVAGRTDIAAVLFGEENDMGARRAREDLNTQLGYMAEDRDKWLLDAEVDYNQAVERNNAAFEKSMTRMAEQYETSMKRMLDAHKKAMGRLEEQHEESTRRMTEAFDRQFEAMTTNFEKLSAAFQTALEKKPVEWSTIVKSGTDGIIAELNAGFSPANKTFMDSMVAAVEEQWGKDSKTADAVMALVGLLGAVGGGPSAGEVSPAPGPILPSLTGIDYSAAGLTDVSGGRGTITQKWHNPDSYGPSGTGWHTGIDLSIPIGTTLYAVQDSIVAGIYNTGNKGYGLHVFLQDANEERQILYGHMSSVNVKPGQQLSRGDAVGKSGSTGRSSGPHVHVEARKPPYGYGDDVYPGPWMAEGGVVLKQQLIGVGEAGPEAIIPLDSRGADFLAQAIAKAYNSPLYQGMVTGQPQITYITQTTTEDHSVNVNGPIEVVSDDPQRIGRELERAARLRAVVSPNVKGR